MLRTIFVAVIFGTGLTAALCSRFAALLLYFWFAFFRPDQWMYVDISGLRPSLVLALVVLIPSFLSGKYPNLSHPISIGSLFFMLAALLGQLGAVSPEIGWVWVDYFGKLLVIALLTITLVDTRERFLVAVTVIAGSFGFHAVKAGLASLLAGGVRFAEGPGGTFGDNNGYALAMAMIAPFFVCIAQNAKWRSFRLACAFAPLFIAVAIIGTYSRGGFLALVAAGLTFVLFQRRRFLWMIVVVLLAIPVGVFMTHQAGYLDRLQTIRTYDEENEASAMSRLHFWHVAIVMVSSQPFGLGLFNYESAYDQYDWLDGRFGHRRSVHSSHFQVLAETGILGACAWVFLLGYAFWVAFRIRRRSTRPGLSADDRVTFLTAGNALIASMMAFVVGGSFIALALNDLTWITFALVAALDRISAVAVRAHADAPSAAASVRTPRTYAPAAWTGATAGMRWR
jgi:putative inorganic carbon (HCO3(-)) transporter